MTRLQLEHQLAGARPGAAAIRAVLELEKGPALTRSEAERRLLDLIRTAELPAPEHNVRVLGSEVDMFWPEQGLVVEVTASRSIPAATPSSVTGSETRGSSQRS